MLGLLLLLLLPYVHPQVCNVGMQLSLPSGVCTPCTLNTFCPYNTGCTPACLVRSARPQLGLS